MNARLLVVSEVSGETRYFETLFFSEKMCFHLRVLLGRGRDTACTGVLVYAMHGVLEVCICVMTDEMHDVDALHTCFKNTMFHDGKW